MLAVSGGLRITVGGLRLSARSPLLVLGLAVINFTLWWTQARRAGALTADLDAVWTALERRSTFIVAIALIGGALSLTYATRSASGADASGYVSEAALLTGGRLFYDDPLKDVARGQDPYLTTPLGWRPGPVEGRQSPTYAPGLPMLMAIPHMIAGIDGAASVVVASGVVAVIATGLIAAQFGGGIAGIVAAAFIAFTPVFIFQSIQPMSDVPVTAAWMLVFLLLSRREGSWQGAAGIACAVAVLIRPNLAPLAIVPVLIARRRMAFATPVVIAGAMLAFLQWQWYGSPLRSGYGAADELFSFANVAPNIGRYARWWLTTAPAVLIGIIGAIRLRISTVPRAMTLFALFVIAAYLIYAVFDDWSYLRFLLPALAVAAVFTGVEVARALAPFPATLRVPLLFVLVIGVTAFNFWTARTVDTFKLADQLRRVSTVGEYLEANVPQSAVLLSGEQSGSMRYYTRRPILRWEAASADALNTVIPVLEQSARPVFIVLDAWEEAPFRSKLSAAVPLDWPPMLEAGTSHRTRVWRFDDRARYLRGEPVDTVRTR